MRKEESNNKIYTSEAYQDRKYRMSEVGSYYKIDRPDLLTKSIVSDFNTYRNWNEIDLAFPKIWDDNGKLSVQHPQGKGVRSLFSHVTGVYGHEKIRDYLNVPLLDNPQSREDIRKRTDCSIKALVQASEQGTMGRAVYSYSDFMYCTYLGQVPNNYMLTLRKFPTPCNDHINNSYDEEPNGHLPDIGRLVTWLGTPGNEMSNILSYQTKIPWQENKAPLDETPEQSIGQPGGGGLGQMLSGLDGTYGREVAASGGYGYGSESNMLANMLGGSKVSYGGGVRNLDLSNKNRIVSSRQNAIMKVMVPGGRDEGLDFTQDIKLTFDYKLRSYDGINGRQAMLDLLGNILMVTYLQGKFFPGSYRSVNMAQSNIATNLAIYKRGATSTPGQFMSSMFTSIKQIVSGLGFTKGNIKEALKELGSNILETLSNGLVNKLGRPQINAMLSLISPVPTGNWHLTVGNPRNPILSIGNLILTDATVEHYGPLGLDDFPTGLRVTVNLKHAKPRDSVGIEQMYMQGNYRIYTPMGENIGDLYKNSKKYTRKNTDSESTTKEVRVTKAATGSTKHSTDAYMKYFGTRDLNSISITAQEALVGAETAKRNK